MIRKVRPRKVVTQTLFQSFLYVLCLVITTCEGDDTGLGVVDHCGSDFIIENGYANFDGEDKRIGHSLSITCNAGYQIIGAKVTTCLPDRSWSKNTTCRIKDCGDSVNLLHGHADFSGMKTTYNEIVPVSCVIGYEINGPPYLICLADGTWSPDTTCVKKDCGAKYDLPNGRVSFSGRDTKFTNQIEVACNDGYKIVGDDHITCTSDGTWSRSTKCVIRDCGTEFSIPNGYANFTGKSTTYNSSVPVVCHEGYATNTGTKTITCIGDGTWSGAIQCTIKDCGRHYNISNGYASFPGYDTTFGNIVPILCHEGYSLVGEDFITCLADGTWSRGSYCQIKDCGKNYTLKNGHVDFTGANTTYNQKIPVTCDKGYILVGESEITCLSSGKWSDESKCVPRDCGSDYSIRNANVDFGGKTTINNKVKVICNFGYEMQGDEYITCLSDGTWSNDTSCQLKTCSSTFKLNNGVVHFPNKTVKYKETVQVSCDTGYELRGISIITCLADASWSNDASCHLRDCGTNYGIAHGKVNFTGVNTTYKSKVPVLCDTGYFLHGDSHITCQSDGHWSKFTRCAIIDCGTVFPLDFGFADFAGKATTYQHQVPVVCDTGYGRTGNSHITCQANGKWSSDTICAMKACKNNILEISNGVIHFIEEKETLFNHTVGISCDTGFDLLGDNFTTCRYDGTWATNTICRIKDCGKNFTITNGQVKLTTNKTTVNETVNASCNDGYELQGTDVIKCQADGSWSEATCVKTSAPILFIAVGVGVGVCLVTGAVVVLAVLKKKHKLCFAGRWNKGFCC